MIVVCDASTLIALARIGQLDVLRQAGAQVVIPTAVYEEVVVKGAGKLGLDGIRQASWIETREVSNRAAGAQFRTVRGAGESEAIAEGLNVVGLLAFLVLAKEEGIIHQIRPLLDALRQQGFFLSEDLYHHILRRANES